MKILVTLLLLVMLSSKLRNMPPMTWTRDSGLGRYLAATVLLA